MKILLDITDKSIQIEEPVNLDELFKMVKKILPNDWQKFTLICQEINHYTVEKLPPVIVPPYVKPSNPWSPPWYVHCDNTITLKGAGTYYLST